MLRWLRPIPLTKHWPTLLRRNRFAPIGLLFRRRDRCRFDMRRTRRPALVGRAGMIRSPKTQQENPMKYFLLIVATAFSLGVTSANSAPSKHQANGCCGGG